MKIKIKVKSFALRNEQGELSKLSIFDRQKYDRKILSVHPASTRRTDGIFHHHDFYDGGEYVGWSGGFSSGYNTPTEAERVLQEILTGDWAYSVEFPKKIAPKK